VNNLAGSSDPDFFTYVAVGEQFGGSLDPDPRTTVGGG
jgi:hypothetical protein